MRVSKPKFKRSNVHVQLRAKGKLKEASLQHIVCASMCVFMRSAATEDDDALMRPTIMSLSPLLPVEDFEFGFTTSLCLDDDRLLRCELADKALGVHKVSSKTTHHVVKPPEPRSARDFQSQPRLAWEALYPEGSINPSAPIPGGFGFYLSGPPGEFQQRLAAAKEAVFSYRMMLQQDWEWVKGGKLPGLCE